LVSINAVSGNNVWVAGDAHNSGEPAWPDTVLLHWAVKRWRNALAPRNSWVEDLAARAPGDLWIAGLQGNGDAYGGGAIERRLGIHWQDAGLRAGEVVESFAPDAMQGLWAVGYVRSNFEPHIGFPHYS
jgi:hypothetical protein